MCVRKKPLHDSLKTLAAASMTTLQTSFFWAVLKNFYVLKLYKITNKIYAVWQHGCAWVRTSWMKCQWRRENCTKDGWLAASGEPKRGILCQELYLCSGLRTKKLTSSTLSSGANKLWKSCMLPLWPPAWLSVVSTNSHTCWRTKFKGGGVRCW